MENAKKMIIVSPEVLQRVQNMQQHQQQPSSTASVSKLAGDTVSGLDREMYRLLNDKNINDHDKWDQYNQVLQRYLHFASQKRKPIQLPIIDLSDDVDGGRSAKLIPQSLVGNEEILDTFTKTYKKDVKNFLKAIDGKKDLISWDNDGVVYIEGDKIPHSNIIDLLHDVIRARKSTQPPGWKRLMHVLKEINIPNEFVTNPFSREYLVRIKGGKSDSDSSGGDSNGDNLTVDIKGGESSAAAARRHLDFSSPSSSSRKSTRLGDDYPFGLKSVKTEPPAPSKRSKRDAAASSSSASGVVWEQFKY